MENVTGIVSLEKGIIVRQIYEFLNNIGYKVQHRILFAGHYGVPQQRVRTIFTGIRDYHGDIVFPQPEYYVNAIANFQQSRELCYTVMPLDQYLLKPKTTLWDAIGDLPELKGNGKGSDHDYVNTPHSEYQAALRAGRKCRTSIAS